MTSPFTSQCSQKGGTEDSIVSVTGEALRDGVKKLHSEPGA